MRCCDEGLDGDRGRVAVDRKEPGDDICKNVGNGTASDRHHDNGKLTGASAEVPGRRLGRISKCRHHQTRFSGGSTDPPHEPGKQHRCAPVGLPRSVLV